MVTRSTGPVEVKTFESKSLVERIDTNWRKGLCQLPVQKDFPRLATGLEIVNGNTNYLVCSSLLISFIDLPLLSEQQVSHGRLIYTSH
jgi:hypothetical protein